jgi:SAM-dependent methyltransferase
MTGEQMSEVIRLPAAENNIPRTPKDKSCLLKVIGRYMETCGVDRSQPILVLGGEQEDLDILTRCGFEQIVLSNLDSAGLALDAENIALPDDSYPVVFAHAVLHHCRCPQKAVGEMVRVAQKHVFFLEPNDSWTLRLLVRLGFSFPYELAAVAAHDYIHGGMRDGPIPNYIYRWTEREVSKCVAAYHPERQFDIRAYPYWDFYVNEYELLNRKESHVVRLAHKVGPRNFIAVLHLGQMILNLFPSLRARGNKFFCAVSKRELHPWILSRDGHCFLKRDFEHSLKTKAGAV